MLLYMSNAEFHLAGDGKVCVSLVVIACISSPCSQVLCAFHVIFHALSTCLMSNRLTVHTAIEEDVQDIPII